MYSNQDYSTKVCRCRYSASSKNKESQIKSIRPSRLTSSSPVASFSCFFFNSRLCLLPRIDWFLTQASLSPLSSLRLFLHHTNQGGREDKNRKKASRRTVPVLARPLPNSSPFSPPQKPFVSHNPDPSVCVFLFTSRINYVWLLPVSDANVHPITVFFSFFFLLLKPQTSPHAARE